MLFIYDRNQRPKRGGDHFWRGGAKRGKLFSGRGEVGSKKSSPFRPLIETKIFIRFTIKDILFLSIIGSIVYSWVTFTQKPSTVPITHGNALSTTTLDNRKGTHRIV